MTHHTWTQSLRSLYDKALDLYSRENRDHTSYFTPDELESLKSIGLQSINLYDYAEDFTKYGEPTWETVLLTVSARRDYFLWEMHGRWPTYHRTSSELPAKTDAMEGIVWLPRIIEKARCFLEGGLAEEVMYGCGGDRRFFKEHNLHAADFLRAVWGARWDDKKILAFVRACAGQPA